MKGGAGSRPQEDILLQKTSGHGINQGFEVERGDILEVSSLVSKGINALVNRYNTLINSNNKVPSCLASQVIKLAKYSGDTSIWGVVVLGTRIQEHDIFDKKKLNALFIKTHLYECRCTFTMIWTLNRLNRRSFKRYTQKIDDLGFVDLAIESTMKQHMIN